MNDDNEKLADLHAQFAKETDPQKLAQITDKMGHVFAAKKQRIKQLQDELHAIQVPPIASEDVEPTPSEDISDEGPLFGGRAGAPVPQVDPKDIKAAWEVSQDINAKSRGEGYAIGVGVFEEACKRGADIQAVCYRTSMLRLVRDHSPELTNWTDDVLFRAIAQVPMKWIGVGISRRGFPFDVEDFLRRVREAA